MDITVLNRQKGNIKAQITKINTYFTEEAPTADEVKISSKLDVIIKLESKTDDLKVEYYKILKDADLEKYENEFSEMDDSIQDLKVGFKKLLNSLTVVNKGNNIITGNQDDVIKQTNVKLPEIPLPRFSGLYTDWLYFKSQFKTLIDENSQLNEQQKLYYLQSALTGTAKQLESLEDTYQSLWKALVERFENKRLIVNGHIQELLSFNKLKTESSKELQNLIDSLLKNLRALNQLELKQNKFSELMLINILLPKLDAETRKLFEMSVDSNDLPEWDTFMKVLQKRLQFLESINKDSVVQNKEKINTSKTKSFLLKESSNFCKLCRRNPPHPLYKCPNYEKLEVKKRFDFVKSNKYCVNCLSNKHSRVSHCPSNSKCLSCQAKHHSSLHFTKADDGHLSTSYQNANLPSGTNNHLTDFAASTQSEDVINCLLSRENKATLLSTAIVYIQDIYGTYFPFKCILDVGSQSSYATINCINILKLKQHPANVSVCGLHNTELKVKLKVFATIANKNKTYEQDFELLVVPKIVDLIPSSYLDVSEINLPKGIHLADPEFFKPSRVDIIIGAQYFYDLIDSEQIYLNNGKLTLRKSVFGYIVAGSLNKLDLGDKKVFCGLVADQDHTENLNTLMKRFWEIEECHDCDSIQGNVELYCENHFNDTHSRTETGRYVVKMPMKPDYESQLGQSKKIAIRKLNALHKRLELTPELLSLYKNFMTEYETLGHMEEVKEEIEPNTNYYIPHHSVYKPLSKTTRLRVVFNASIPTTTGYSLNSLLLNGGVSQDELFNIILRFRTHKIAFIADVEKMFRQILIHPEQRNLQRIVWKDNMHDEIKLFRLNTVTYGTVSAPFLATRTLKQLAMDEYSRFPEASSVVKSDVYMDDVVSGEQNLEKALILQDQLIQLFQAGGMKLYKWISNSKTLLNHVPHEDRNYNFDSDETVKTLGLIWNPDSDCFQFTVSPSIATSAIITKRTVLSDVSKLFDPLGLLGPIIVKAKMFIQKLWLLKLNWDETLPEKESNFWQSFTSTLHLIREIKVDRYVLCDDILQLEIHGFADASEKAYGAVLYLRCLSTDGKITVNLLSSKSRVAPLKTISIPRLELCAALLLAKLSKKVTESLKLNINLVKLYTDSTIVLAWIRNEPHVLKTFVANRISKIQQLTNPQQWNHINTTDNAADILSRGSGVETLHQNDEWWTGPRFLQIDELPDSATPSVSDSEEYLHELKPNVDSSHTYLNINDSNDTIDKIISCSNNYSKIIRVFSFIYRFLNNCQRVKTKRTGPLDNQEIRRSENFLIRYIQEIFGKEIKSLQIEGKVASNSQVRSLNPYLDDENILRVGGRLSHSNLPLAQKFPIILPSNHKLTYLIIKEYHLRYMHLGPQSLLYQVRQRFWPLKGRNICRKVVYDCLTCFKAKPKICEQIMGNLPKERVTPSSPFMCSGIDFCGPFTVKYKYQRKGIFHKIYLAVFICFATKAVHIELVTDLTSQSFIAALKRFFSRRGKSAYLYTDNAKNFIGSNNELKKLFNLVNHPDETLSSYMSQEKVEWKFVPPRAPNFGGLWEAGVKSIKHHLKRVISNAKLNYEEFLTVVNQIEAILNSRPLTPLSTDVDDLAILTPGHFLIGRPITSIVEPSLINISENKLSAWQRVTKFNQLIWKNWSRDYLSHLQQRHKWQFAKINIKKGDLVLIKDDQVATGNWPRGKILDVFPGPDGKIRVVKIKTQTGIYKRPVSKVALLPMDYES